VVVGADDVDLGKSHPKTCAIVAEKLCVAPENYLVLEDAILGEHARRHCVAVTTNLAAADFQAPLLAIRDFIGLTPQHVRTLLSQVGQAPKADDVTKSQNLQPVEEALN
jgi:beta-phosphoglucomutase-like phosphatase (HAD superfamily)